MKHTFANVRESRCLFYGQKESPSTAGENPRAALVDQVAKLIKDGDLASAKRLIVEAERSGEGSVKAIKVKPNEKPARSPEFQRKLLQVSIELEKQLKDHEHLKQLGSWEVKPINGGTHLQFACKSREDEKIRWTALPCVESEETDGIGYGHKGGVQMIAFHANADVKEVLRALSQAMFFDERGVNFGPNQLGTLQPDSWSTRSVEDASKRGRWLYTGDYVPSKNGLKGDVAEDPAKPTKASSENKE